jgi:DNA primase
MEISEIKERLDIVQLVESYNFKVNRNNMVCCPFHEDKKASLQLYPKTNTWHCFGCNKGADQLDFIEYQTQCTKKEAIQKAKELIGFFPIKEKVIEKEIAPLPENQRIAILQTAFTYFARSVNSSQSAKNYLHSRNLDAKKLNVGYDGHSFHKATNVTPELKELYARVGLLTANKTNTGYASFFSSCVVFPTLNQNGDIVNLYGRFVTDNGNIKHKYLPGKHLGIHPSYPAPNTTKLIINECIIDTATLQQYESITKEYSLLSCFGTNNFTEEMQTAIGQLQHLKEVIFFFDGDKAGREAVQTHAQSIHTQCPHLKISYVETPDNEDVNSLSKNYGANAEEYFLNILENRLIINRPQTLDTRPQTQDLRQGEERPKEEFGYVLDTQNPEQLIYTNNLFTITIWGGIEVRTIKKLRVTLKVEQKEKPYFDYRDTIDLYVDRSRTKLMHKLIELTDTSSSYVLKTISTLTTSLENYRDQERKKELQQEEENKKKNEETFTNQELQQGYDFLQAEDLMQQTENHIKNIGLVGEENKGMLLFFILLTRMFKNPLHALVQGKSGSGKTYLLKKIASLLPKNHIRTTTALTENTLYHSAKGFWKHMVLLIEDLDGVLGALLPLREMMSNQSISKFSTEKDLKTGEFKQMELYVEGPVCVAGATTKDSIYEDNANRSFLIQVNESPEHQERVLEFQRTEIAGLRDKTGELKAQFVFKTAQLHLEPMEVVIPFGDELRIPDYVFKKLRTNAHYLTLVKAIAFWHQAQREVKLKSDGTKYIEANLNDVEWANRLSKEVLLRKSDELNGALRGFFESVKSWMQSVEKESFYSKEVREKFRMNPMQVNRYIRELEQRGYVKQAGGNRKSGFEFMVVVWDDYEQLKSGMNILDETLEKLRKRYK